MNSQHDIDKRRARRPYWLLLVLALFVAGQVAAAGHWHDNSDTHHADCALCLLSSANGAAAIDSTVPFIAVALSEFVFLFTLPATRGGFSRCYDSRAPPVHF